MAPAPQVFHSCRSLGCSDMAFPGTWFCRDCQDEIDSRKAAARLEHGQGEGAEYVKLSRSLARRLEDAAWACVGIAVLMYVAWLLLPFWLGVLDRIADLLGGQ